jgi:hypothetical protein
MRFRTLRRLIFVAGLALLLAVPATAGKARPKPGDGTLSVRDGRGTVHFIARGTVIGRVDVGEVVAVDRNPFDDNEPILRGGRSPRGGQTETTTTRVGRNIRFRLTGGAYRLTIRGRGIDLAAVGKGSVTLNGDERFADTGLYSLNGGEFNPVPYERTTLQLAAQPPPGG